MSGVSLTLVHSTGVGYVTLTVHGRWGTRNKERLHLGQALAHWGSTRVIAAHTAVNMQMTSEALLSHIRTRLHIAITLFQIKVIYG